MAKNQSKRLLTNSLFNLVPFVNQVLMGILLVPFIVRHLGDAAYGTWALISSVLVYSTLLTLGLNSGVNRWVPMLLARGDTAGINRVVSTVLTAYGAAAAILCVLVAALVYGFPLWFDVPADLESASRMAVALVGLSFVGLVQLTVFSGVLSGVERYDLLASTQFLRGLIQIAGVIAVLVFDGGLVALAWVYGVANLCEGVLAGILAFRALPELKPRLSLANLTLLREMMVYSANTLLFTIQEVLQRQSSLVMIGAFIGVSSVTEYAMPLVMVTLLTAAATSLTSVTKPAASRMEVSGEHEPIRSLFVASTKLTLMIALPVGAVFCLYGDRILRLWLREAYSEGQPAILAVLACSAVFLAWVRPAFYLVVGLGKHRLFGQLVLAKVLISLAVGVVGLRWFQWGTFEVALAFAIPDILSVVIVLIPYCTRSVALPMTRFVREGVVPALLANLPVLVSLWLLESQLRAFQGFAFVSALAVVGTLAPVGFWLIGLTPSEKRLFLEVAGVQHWFTRSDGDAGE